MKDHFGELVVGGRHVKVGRKKIEWDGVDWIHLAQDREKWRAVTQSLMNLRVP